MNPVPKHPIAPLPAGLFRYRLTLIDKPEYQYTIVASCPAKAWRKYLELYFRNCPLKPNKTDYRIQKA